MKHILVVDDNKQNLVMAKEALGDIYKVTAVTMGSQAIKFLEANTCDLILLDIYMPEMDGFEVLEHIRRLDGTENIPVIFLTSDGEAEVENKCFELGAQDFITKPFVPMVIRSRISRILEVEELRASLADRLEKKTQEVIDIQVKSQKDPLTGLWNRTYTERLVNEKIGMGDKGAVFMMDMDNFKAINDTYGHIAGDQALKMFADSLIKNCEEKDVLCRIGGDEFVVYVSDVKSDEELGDIAMDIINDFLAKINNNELFTRTSVSVGIARYPIDGDNFLDLYNNADKALYHVKRNGKNSYHFYSDYTKAENERAKNLVDLEYIRDVMSRGDSGKGAYLMDYDNFQHVYNFVRRFAQRSQNDMHTILFTANTLGDRPVESEDLEIALEALEECIYSSLRRSDIYTRYSTKQIIVVLMDSKDEGSDKIAARILDSFSEIYTRKLISFDFDIAKVEEDI